MKIKKLATTFAVVAMSAGFIASTHASGPQKSTAATPQFEGQRLPSVRTPGDIEKLDHLNKSQKKMALESLRRVPPTDGWWVMGSSPETQMIFQTIERSLLSALHPAFQAIPLSDTNLMTILVSAHRKSEYAEGLLSSYTEVAADALEMKDVMTKLELIDHPNSPVWTPEQSLMIRFTNAALDTDTMTDELFEEARAAWGENKILLYLTWIGYVDSVVRICDVAGLDYHLAMNPPPGAITREEIERTVNFSNKKASKQLWENWIELPAFDLGF